MKSRFVDNCGKLTKPKLKFEHWLLERGFDAVNSNAYIGATHAAALVDEFLEDYPEFLKWSDNLYDHADEIGYVSDSQDDRDSNSGEELEDSD